MALTGSTGATRRRRKVNVRRIKSMGTIKITRVITSARSAADDPTNWFSSSHRGRKGEKEKRLGFPDADSRDADREVPEELDRVQHDPGNGGLEDDRLLRLPERDVRCVVRETSLDLSEKVRPLGRICGGGLLLNQGVHARRPCAVVVPVPEGRAATRSPVQEREDVVVRVEIV